MFKKMLLVIGVLFFSQYVFSNNTYPKDLQTFMDKRDQCDHLRGEGSGELDIDNARNLKAELDKYCTGTDRELKKLKNKYQKNYTILQILEEYDENIEPKANPK